MSMTARVSFAGDDVPNDDVLHACVHCGLCLSACPTYRETGVEVSSPRGRIYLIKAVAEGRIGMEQAVFQEQMDQCLNCRACEAVCPSGVQYGQLVEASRAQVVQARADGRLPRFSWGARMLRRIAFGVLFQDLRWFRFVSRVIWLYQRSGVQRAVRAVGVLRALRLAEVEALLPPMSDRFVVPQGQIFPAEGQQRFVVALLSGCVMATAFAKVHAATIRVLQKNGCRVIVPPDQGCCGALHVHGGDMQGGRALARRNITAFEALGIDALIVNAAGCGAALKEYGHLLAQDAQWTKRAQTFSAKVKDISEFLAGIELNVRDLKPLPIHVTYQEPCHLAHAQRISAQPRALLRAIPGLTLTEMQESALCCGSAGVYNMTQPEMATNLGARKLRHVQATAADVVVTANPGCFIQLADGLRRCQSTMQVHHIVELLDRSYHA